MRARLIAVALGVCTIAASPHPARADEDCVQTIASQVYSLAESYRLDGRFVAARKMYRRYLREAPADHPRRADARRYISMIDRALLQRAVARAVAPLERHAEPIRSSLDGKLFIAGAAATAVSMATIGYGHLRANAAERDVADALSRTQQPELWTDYVGRGIDVCANSRRDDVVASDPDTARAVASACTTGHRWDRIAAVAVPVAVMGAITTGVFGYLTVRGERSEESRLRIAPMVSPTEAGAHVQLDF